jgi:hypothetical protein
MAVEILPNGRLSADQQTTRQLRHRSRFIMWWHRLALIWERRKVSQRATPLSACRVAHQPWDDLSSGGDEAMERVLDPSNSAGRPTEPSKAADEVDLGTIRRIRAGKKTV